LGQGYGDQRWSGHDAHAARLFGDRINGGKAGRFDDMSRGVVAGGNVRPMTFALQ
jgi:hypothetical protein